MLKANREVVAVLAGVFFFVPFTALFLVLFGSDIMAAMQASNGEADPEFVSEQVSIFMGQYWWLMLLVGLLQVIGGLALVMVLADPARPSVRETIGRIPALLLTIVAVQILTSIISQVGMFLGYSLPGAVGAIFALLAWPLLFYFAVRFSVVTPVVGIEGQRNPIEAIKRSWMITRGNAGRIFALFLLLAVAGVVLMMVLALIVSLVLAVLGERGEAIGMAAFYGLVMAAAYTVAFAVVAAIHRQLGGTGVSVPPSGKD